MSVRFYFECYGDHRCLHVLTHSFPPRLSTDLHLVGNEQHVVFPADLEAALEVAVRRNDDAAGGEDRLGDEGGHGVGARSEEHTSELQSLMRISYAVFCLKKKTQAKQIRGNVERKSNHNNNT